MMFDERFPQKDADYYQNHGFGLFYDKDGHKMPVAVVRFFDSEVESMTIVISGEYARGLRADHSRLKIKNRGADIYRIAGIDRAMALEFVGILIERNDDNDARADGAVLHLNSEPPPSHSLGYVENDGKTGVWY